MNAENVLNAPSAVCHPLRHLRKSGFVVVEFYLLHAGRRKNAVANNNQPLLQNNLLFYNK